jgi:hypothetical protein
MRKFIGYAILYVMLSIGLSDFYFDYSPDNAVGTLSVLATLFLTFGIATALIGGEEL